MSNTTKDINLEAEISSFFKGELATDDKTLTAYSHDASLCEVMPAVVAYPKDSEDIQAIVKYVAEHKKTDPSLSVTVRAAGTCMAGGPINDSIIVDVMRNMHGVLDIDQLSATVLPGTFYRDFEVETLKHGVILPCYTASKNLNAIGGMIGNNSAGEKTLRYGKMENYIQSLNVVFADGNEYVVKPLSRDELDKKIEQSNHEGTVYREIWKLIKQNEHIIEAAKPNVSKNSAGYYLWNVWDKERNVFDLTKLIVGSQGTLGIVTKAKLRLVPVRTKSKLFVIFLRDLTRLSELVNVILELNPESLETYDDATMKLAVRFFPEMLRSMKATNFLKLIFSFIPEGLMMLSGGLPKLILLVEFAGNTDEEIDAKMKILAEKVRPFKVKSHIAQTASDSEKYWTIRRESFNLLRKHVHGRRTAPFVDDIIVRPEVMPEFLPKMREILDSYKLVYTIAGHAGNGNFHIIPLMDMKDRKNIDVIMEVSSKVYDLVVSYGGSITAEHNDGIIRTPYLSKMYKPEVLELFKKTKDIFDPQNILNPGKKVPGIEKGTMEYLREHIVKE
jgi:FAD/FMN-containing dehydrogenase